MSGGWERLKWMPTFPPSISLPTDLSFIFCSHFTRTSTQPCVCVIIGVDKRSGWWDERNPVSGAMRGIQIQEERNVKQHRAHYKRVLDQNTPRFSIARQSKYTCESDRRVTRGQVAEEQHGMLWKVLKYMVGYFKTLKCGYQRLTWWLIKTQ